MKNKKSAFSKNTSKSYLLTLFLMCIVGSCYSQWKTAASKNIKSDIIITYEVIYDIEPSLEQKKLPEYISEITIAFNQEYMIERKLGDKSKTINSYSLFDFNALKGYSCNVLGNSKSALQYEFKDPKTPVESMGNVDSKIIVGYPCEKGLVMINHVPKEIYYTKKIGLKYCKQYKIDGLLLEYPEYNKTLGYYTVKAKKIILEDLPKSFYSLDDFNIKTVDDYKKDLADSKMKTNELRLEFIGKKAKTFKDITIKQDKIDTKKIIGDIIVYNFWFTTCGPCKAEIPKLNELKAKYKDKNIHFIAIALDPEYKITPFLSKTRFDYDIIAEGHWVANNLFDVNAYPTNIIVDKKGIIQFYEIGYKSDILERMTSTLDKCLEQ